MPIWLIKLGGKSLARLLQNQDEAARLASMSQLCALLHCRQLCAYSKIDTELLDTSQDKKSQVRSFSTFMLQVPVYGSHM